MTKMHMLARRHIKPNNAIVLTICLVAVFSAFFAWCLYRSCKRAVTAEAYELRYHRDVEAQKQGT